MYSIWLRISCMDISITAMKKCYRMTWSHWFNFVLWISYQSCEMYRIDFVKYTDQGTSFLIYFCSFDHWIWLFLDFVIAPLGIIVDVSKPDGWRVWGGREWGILGDMLWVKLNQSGRKGAEARHLLWGDPEPADSHITVAAYQSVTSRAWIETKVLNLNWLGNFFKTFK